MLRLRVQDRYTILHTPLSLTTESYGNRSASPGMVFIKSL